MTTLLVGFDSAWTPTNSGAIVGALRTDDGTLQELGLPQIQNYLEAEKTILEWQKEWKPTDTIILIDQPTIVKNSKGQRPVENLVASPVSRRYGGVQPANTARKEMFGKDAPIWNFLRQFDGPADPQNPITNTQVLETYPVLTMIALGWVLPDSKRPTGRLPKYNPVRKRTFSISDWEYICQKMIIECDTFGLKRIAEWLTLLAVNRSPRKAEQDSLDSCICLLVALYLVELRKCLMVGDMDTGYIVIPSGDILFSELHARCDLTNRVQGEWVRPFIFRSFREPNSTKSRKGDQY